MLNPSGAGPAPEPDYQQGLERGVLLLQRSRSSGRHFFYPRMFEPGTGDDDIEWTQASGAGVVYSTTVVRSRPPAANYNVALIDLAEGPRLMSRVDGVEPDAVMIGMAVTARVIEEDGKPLLVFFAVGGAV